MNIEKFLNTNFLTTNVFCARILPALSTLGTSLGIYLVFLIVPNEQVMGAVQRVFYFHVASALASLGAVDYSLGSFDSEDFAHLHF